MLKTLHRVLPCIIKLITWNLLNIKVMLQLILYSFCKIFAACIPCHVEAIFISILSLETFAFSNCSIINFASSTVLLISYENLGSSSIETLPLISFKIFFPNSTARIFARKSASLTCGKAPSIASNIGSFFSSFINFKMREGFVVESWGFIFLISRINLHTYD